MLHRGLIVLCFCVLSTAAFAQSEEKIRQQRAAGPKPTVSDYVYGSDSDRQTFDFWQAKSDKSTPVLLMIHGGGWQNGNKSVYARDVQAYLDQGVSVASINYRFINEAMKQKVEPPVKACVHDAARALQTIRAKAGEWNIDPKRIGATGGSAGACTSIWLALHDDLADPSSNDPIARQSSRLTCAAVDGAQTSLDPTEVREWIPNAIYGGHAFGFAGKGRKRPEEFELLIANREMVSQWFKEYSPIELVSSDDPPIYLNYPDQKAPPVAGQETTDPTHSAVYGIKLAEKLKAVGVEAVVSYPQEPDKKYGSNEKFFLQKLKAK
jgi:acetyl esterase/lipase